MKLGEMQRYTAEVEQISPKPIIYHKFDNDGLWCLFSDAQAKSLADERRIAATEHHANEWADIATNGLQWLRNVKDGTSTCDEAIEDMLKNIQSVRAALSVETQEKPNEG